MTKPNVLYIHSHDTGRYIQPYGHAVPTPSIQRFAEQGVLFRQAFCANPTCSPSRASLVTGQYAHSNGMYGLAHRGLNGKGFRLHNPEHHIAHVLRGEGYATALAGVQHVTGHSPEDLDSIGYNTFLTRDKRPPKPAAVDFIDNAPAQPFFLSVGFGNTHRAFPEPGADENPNYCIPPAPFPDTAETRRDMAAFKASARCLDDGMGAVFDALERNGLEENTLVICTTDHGIAFPRMKCNLTDGGIGVMLMMRGPAGFTGGKVSDALVSHVDIFPTICDLLGIAKPDWLQGTSLAPLAAGDTDTVREQIFAEVNFHGCYEPMRCVRTERWKYMVRHESRKGPILPNCDDSPTKSVWLENGWRGMPPEDEALYDLFFDPTEKNNLASDPGHSHIRDDMKARLANWMTETSDPLLDGPLPPVPGAQVNDPDGLSPQEETFTAKL